MTVRFWPFPLAPVFADTPDANSGGGTVATEPPPAGTEGAETSGETPDAPSPEDLEQLLGPTPTPPADDAGDDEGDEDADSISADEDWPTERRAKLLKAHKRLKREITKLRSLKKKVGDDDLDELRVKARQFSALSDVIRSDPELAERLLGRLRGKPPSGDRPARSTSRSRFDRSTLPFDPNDNDANRYFADMAEQHHEMRGVIETLTDQVKHLEAVLAGQHQAQQQDVQQRTQAQWSQITDAAAKHIPSQGAQVLFRDAMIAAFREYGGRVDPRVIVRHYLKELNVGTTAKKRATDAAAERMAQQNAKLPSAPTGGRPAGARGDERPMLADIHKRIRGQAR